MRRSKFAEAQILDVVREYDAYVSPKELARRHGIHASTIRLWTAKYVGMNVRDVVRLKQLEAENAQNAAHHRSAKHQPYEVLAP